MKTMKTILSVLFLAGAMGSSIASAAGAENVISKDVLTGGELLPHKVPGDRGEDFELETSGS
jgi:hypothetical protein